MAPPTNMDHNRLIRDAARGALAPLGLTQRGVSRTWLDDRGWWLIVVEFQPSDWARGTYLNVGAHWLWRAGSDLSFDLGYRVNGLQDLTAPAAAQVALEIAKQAAAEVKRYRDLFPNVGAVAQALAEVVTDGWSLYHAGIAAALGGDYVRARSLLARLAIRRPDDLPWMNELRDRTASLIPILEIPQEFAAKVTAIVRDTRRALRLPEWEGPVPQAPMPVPRGPD